MRSSGGALFLLLAALVACKSADSSSAPSSRASAAPPPAPVAPSAPPSATVPAERPLAELFDGPPPAALLGKRVTGKYEGTWHVSVPNGWTADTEQYHGMVVLTNADKTARMFMSDGIGAATDKNMDFWVRGGFIHAADVSWDKPHADGKLGPNHRKARINTGKGKLFKKPASFWAIRPEDPKAGVLIEGGLVDGAADSAKHELLAAMQSVEEK